MPLWLQFEMAGLVVCFLPTMIAHREGARDSASFILWAWRQSADRMAALATITRIGILMMVAGVGVWAVMAAR